MTDHLTEEQKAAFRKGLRKWRVEHTPVVTIFVRHSADCKYAGDEFCKRCDCSKHLRWTHERKQVRISAHTRSWAEAERKKREIEDQLTGRVPETKPRETQRGTRQAVETYLTAKTSENLTKATIRKLRFQLGQFVDFVEKRSKFFPAEITSQDVIDFRASWTTWGDLTRIKAQQNLRGFIRFACKGNRDELLDALGAIKQTREGRERRKPKPLTEAELEKLLAQVPITFEDEPSKIPLVTAFIKGAVGTGLACVDMVHLERKALMAAKHGLLTIERRKTGRKATPRIDNALREELLAVMNGNPRYVFWNGNSLPGSATGLWQTDLRRLFDEAGLWIKGNLSHRFRDTAVDFWLGQGCSLTDIAAMLGDTVAIVERHYADLAGKRMEERLLKVPARRW
jgi:integrase/recombinase XerD